MNHAESLGRIQAYVESLEIVSHTTNDFLFIFDVVQKNFRFFGSIDKNFQLRRSEDQTVSVEDLLSLVHPSDRKGLMEDLERIISGVQKSHDMHYRWINRQGQTVWINCRATVIPDDSGSNAYLLGVASEETLRHLYNPLTGLWNQHKLRSDLPGIWAEDSGYLMLLDINGLAAINLEHGRHYGDLLLKESGDMLEYLPECRRVYHINNNIFAAILSCEEQSQVQAVFEAIRRKMKSKCTYSCSAVPNRKALFLDGISMLDSAMLTLNKAKLQGKDTLALFSAEEIQQNIRAQKLLEEMKQSVENRFAGFKLLYQPQIYSGTYQLYGLEALLRYQSPALGFISPVEFIPILEQTHLIDAVGLWVLEEALQQCKQWRSALPDLHISVNFSMVQFEDPDLAEKILGVLERLQMPGDALTVEITESFALQESGHFRNTLKQLHTYGISLSIDDFGSGYSNLGHLKQLNVDEVKIDRFFIQNLAPDTYNHRLVSSIIEFAHASNIHVCCEGVESTKELSVLEGIQPELLQGYLFDRPSSPEQIYRTYVDSTTPEYAERMRFVQELRKLREKSGIVYFNPKEILQHNNVGLWIIRINQEEQYFEMHADETMDRIMAAQPQFTPEECYKHWYSRIREDYVPYVNENVQVMMDINKVVQLQYPWIHPTMGEVIVRCSGKRQPDEDGMIVLSGYHRIVSEIEGA